MFVFSSNDRSISEPKRSVWFGVESNAVWRVIMFAIAFMAAFKSSAASASCGDWLAHPSVDVLLVTETSHRTETHVSGGHLATGNRENKIRHPSRGACHGPSCQRAPDQPIPPSSVVVSVSTELAAVLPSTPMMTGLEQDSWLQSCHEHPATGFPFRIEHPPR
jgi:hypothetical protein